MQLSAVFGSTTVNWSSEGHTHVIPEENQCTSRTLNKQTIARRTTNCITTDLTHCNEPQSPTQFEQDMDTLLQCTQNANAEQNGSHTSTVIHAVNIVFTPPPSPSPCASPPPPACHTLQHAKTATRPRQAPRRALYTPANSDDDIPEVCPFTSTGVTKIEPNAACKTQEDHPELEYVLDCGCATLCCSINDPPIQSTQCFGSFVKTFYTSPLINQDGMEYPFLFHCLLCEYVTSRKYRAERHRESVHKHNGKAMKRKRLFQDQHLSKSTSKRKSKLLKMAPQ